MNNRIIVGGILGALIMLAIAIWFPILSNTSYEIVEKETIHPCQQIIFDHFEILYTISSFDRDLATLQEMQTFTEKYEGTLENTLKEFKENIIKHDCQDTTSEWNTSEFEAKLKFLTEYGFLP